MTTSHREPSVETARVVEIRTDLRRALEILKGLPERQQEVLRLRFMHDLSYRQISSATGVTLSNVGYQIHTGLAKIREQLKNAQPSPEARGEAR